MKKVQFLIIMVLCVAFPLRQAAASVPDFNPIMNLGNVQFSDATTVHNIPIDTSTVQFVYHEAVTLDKTTVKALLEDDDRVLPPNLDKLEEDLQDDLLIPQEGKLAGSSSKTKRHILEGVSLLLAASLIVALVAMLSGGSGGHGSHGNNGSGPGGNNGKPGGPGGSNGNGFNGGPGGGDHFFSTGAGEGSGGGFWEEGKNGKDGDQFELNFVKYNNYPNPSTVPNNPEPATFLLMLLGLGMPMLRKRQSA